MSNQILKQNIESLNKQLKWLERSFNICKSMGIKDSYRETELDNFDELLKLTPELINVFNKTIKYANQYISNE
ncbi:Hypothetical protein IALB_1652 [Ignavibacterium album JCM 16511]|uniref:Uncharacterized protein n=1 Tax=Ignavibacterium album (strain DSM 19864 / JCM 16511 / NBRC 101810 / Mat9-16) TaxID=945713 RepID=I0AK53_IGNAJ|nr:hypothetical protein [Ignavibacterium album]AFH49360.1 Hypothetical protein IALB_1652 [Ignavibacterium album JCM 16511]